MKKVLAVFFGLVLLSQVFKFYQLGQPPTVKRQPPAPAQPVKPAHGGQLPVARVMLAGGDGKTDCGNI